MSARLPVRPALHVVGREGPDENLLPVDRPVELAPAPEALTLTLSDLPVAAALCDAEGVVVAGNTRLRSGLPDWMHARVTGTVPLFAPGRLDAAQRSAIAHGGTVSLDLGAPRERAPEAPQVRLRITRAPVPAHFLVVADVCRGGLPAPPGPAYRLLDDDDVQRTLEAAGLGSWDLDLSRGHLRVCQRTAQLLGHEFTDVATSRVKWRSLLDPADAARTDLALEEYLRGDRASFQVEQRLRTRSGEPVWLLAAGRAVEWDGQGRVVRLEGLHFDVTARRLAEQRLQESEARFRALADDAPVLIWTAGVDGRVDYLNRRWLEFTGRSLDEQLAEGWASAMHPDDRPRVVARHEQAFACREPFEVEYRMRRHDGEYRWMTDQGQPRRLEDGSFAGFVGSCIDVTERRRAAEALAINESRLKLAFAAWGAGYFEYTRDLSRGYVDRRFAELFDLAATDFPAISIVRHVQSLVVPEDLPPLLSAFAEVLRGEQDVMDFTYRVVTPDGRRRWIRTMGQLVSHDPHQPRHDMFAGVVFDVSDEHALQDRLSLQLAGLEAAANAIVITDREGRVVWVNPAFTTLTGYAREDVVGQTPRLLQSGQHPPGFYEDFWRTITSGAVWSGELQNRRKDGTIYPEEMTVTPVRGADGEIANFIAIKRDITERKRAEAALISARNAADAANQMKSQFLAMMSHELRTPLNGLIGFTELLRATPLSVEQAEYVATMRASSETLLAVINDILDYSKVESGRLELEQAPFPVRDVVTDAVRLFGPRAREKGIALGVRVDDAVPATIRGDVTRLRQVVANLVGNAVKFTEAGRVDVVVQALHGAAPRLRLAVADTGIGIPADRIERLFQPFSQVDASTTRRYGGTGLGLSICDQLVRLMGGTLTVTSTVGRGSTFLVDVPMDVAEDGAARPGDDGQRLDPTCGERFPLAILVVEDNLVNQKLARATLRKLGYAPEIVDSGPAAIDRVRRGGIECVLMDVQMPGMDGFEATRAIRALPGGDALYVSAMTAHSMEGDSQRCLDEGMNDYLAKPFRPADLSSVLARAHAWLRPGRAGGPAA